MQAGDIGCRFGSLGPPASLSFTVMPENGPSRFLRLRLLAAAYSVSCVVVDLFPSYGAPFNQRVQATPESALGEFVAAWPGAPDPGRYAKHH
jgi:hypothetical protein